MIDNTLIISTESPKQEAIIGTYYRTTYYCRFMLSGRLLNKKHNNKENVEQIPL